MFSTLKNELKFVVFEIQNDVKNAKTFIHSFFIFKSNFYHAYIFPSCFCLRVWSAVNCLQNMWLLLLEKQPYQLAPCCF